MAIPLLNPEDNGLPQRHELAALNPIEDALVARFERDRKAVAVLVITTGGMREFVFYTGDAEWAADVVAAVRQTITTHDVQSYVVPDRDWSVYRAFH